MADTTVLFVGEDHCHRIPVMESKGIRVARSACSVAGVRAALAQGDWFSAVTFHNDLFAPPEPVVVAAREIISAPLVLFRNEVVDCNERPFDLVIPVPTSPEVWSRSLAQVIEASRRLRERSEQLRQDCVDLRECSLRLREATALNCTNSFDYDALFRVGDGMREDD